MVKVYINWITHNIDEDIKIKTCIKPGSAGSHVDMCNKITGILVQPSKETKTLKV